MKLNEFIASVLQDIDNGLKDARNHASRKYRVETADNRGVHFDIAVTTVSSNTSEAEGQAKAGFVEVLGANVGGKLQNKSEHSEVSRIQFTVYVPFQTEQEETESILRQQQNNRNDIENSY